MNRQDPFTVFAVLLLDLEFKLKLGVSGCKLSRSAPSKFVAMTLLFLVVFTLIFFIRIFVLIRAMTYYCIVNLRIFYCVALIANAGYARTL